MDRSRPSEDPEIGGSGSAERPDFATQTVTRGDHPMRDTVWAIILTQAPIAIACIWVAVEMRGIRRSLEGAELSLRDITNRQSQDQNNSTL